MGERGSDSLFPALPLGVRSEGDFSILPRFDVSEFRLSQTCQDTLDIRDSYDVLTRTDPNAKIDDQDECENDQHDQDRGANHQPLW